MPTSMTSTRASVRLGPTVGRCFNFRSLSEIAHLEPLPQNGWENTKKVTASTIPSVGMEYLTKILSSQVYDIAHDSPLTYASILSTLTENQIHFKREDTQPVFSFKIRGAYNKIASLSTDLKGRGVVACSAGNHAQGVAMSAARMGIRATIVMPLATPTIKLKAVQRFGGAGVTVKLHGQNYDEAAAEAKRLVVEQGLTMIHPFDDPYVIAGQGTIGKEIVKSFSGRRLDAVFCCVGGGGLLAGVAAYVKSVRPDVMVIGVEADDAAGMTQSLIAGKVVTLPYVGLFADGAAVRTVGSETFRICEALVDAMVTVSTDEICAAIKHGFNDTRCVMEPAGALAIAGMLKYARQKQWKDKAMVAVCSGANMDFDRLRFVSERADGSEMMFSVSIPEQPGAFRTMYQVLYPRVITEFSYRHDGTAVANNMVSVKGPSAVPSEADKQSVMQALRAKGYTVVDLSNNELAKVHLRHMAGGRSFNLTQDGKLRELVYRFEFPEAPGALSKFLDSLNFTNQGWNISLFHYRNHGGDFGRVLVGILLEPDDIGSFHEFLDKLGYANFDETENSTYLQFLK